MRVKLDDKHYLNSDQSCFWITVEIAPKDSKGYERRVSGYHRTFTEVVESYIEQKLRSSEAITVKELDKEVKQLKKQVRGWKDAPY